MSNNVKFLNQPEAIPYKNYPHKKISHNSKNIPGGASKPTKSFRGKV